MDSKNSAESERKVPKHIGPLAALALSTIAAASASAAVPGTKYFEGSSGSGVHGTAESGAPGRKAEDLGSKMRRWVEETFAQSQRQVYEKGSEYLHEATDPLGDEWIVFKVEFKETRQTNLYGCHSGICLPLDPNDVRPEHKSFLERAEREAKILPNVHESLPDPVSGERWLAATIMHTEREGVVLLMRPDKMMHERVTRDGGTAPGTGRGI